MDIGCDLCSVLIKSCSVSPLRIKHDQLKRLTLIAHLYRLTRDRLREKPPEQEDFI